MQVFLFMDTTHFYQYLASEKRYSPHTITSYKNDLESFCEYLHETYEIDSAKKVTLEMLRSWVVYLAEKNFSNKSINRKTSTLKSYFCFLQRIGDLEENPAKLLPSLKLSKHLPIFLREDDMGNVTHLQPDTQNWETLRNHLIVELFYATGIRESELIGLKNVDIDFGKNILKIKGKGNKERFIPFTDELKQKIEAYISERNKAISYSADNLFVTSKGKPIYPMFVYRIVKQYISMVSTIDKRSPHVLRHTFATHLLDNGSDINAIKDLLGHSSLAATQVYTHNTIEKLKKSYKAHPRANV